jgi:hypothetical protein
MKILIFFKNLIPFSLSIVIFFKNFQIFSKISIFSKNLHIFQKFSKILENFQTLQTFHMVPKSSSSLKITTFFKNHWISWKYSTTTYLLTYMALQPWFCQAWEYPSIVLYLERSSSRHGPRGPCYRYSRHPPTWISVFLDFVCLPARPYTDSQQTNKTLFDRSSAPLIMCPA